MNNNDWRQRLYVMVFQADTPAGRRFDTTLLLIEAPRADAPDVLKTEHQLMQNIPQSQWSRAHHWLIYHGRRVCKAQRPLCGTCALRDVCLYVKGA